MYAQPDTQNSLVLSYLTLRRAVGCIGITLPFVLAYGKMLFESPGILDSISYYYHSAMRDIFVGSLCAIAVFLLSYRGYDWLDDLASNFAGVCAIGIALFPTTPHVGATQQERIVGMFHLFFATCFMLTLAFTALFLFRKTDQSKKPTRRKQQRNKIYLVCGITIVACLVLIGLIDILPNNLGIQQLSPIFWLESIAVVAFGISWFVKGQTILKDAE